MKSGLWRESHVGMRSMGIASLFLILGLAYGFCSLRAVAEPSEVRVEEPSALKLPPAVEFGGDTLVMDAIARVVPNRAFDVGENLEFDVGYGPVPAGKAAMRIVGIKQVRGRDSYHIISKARSNWLFSLFFEVKDRVESLMDTRGLFSWHFEKHLREGRYKADIVVDYDQVNHLAISRKDTMRVAPYVLDILAALYYVRTQELQVGQSLFIECHDGRKSYPLEVVVLRKERVKVPAGKFSCFVVEPRLRGEGIFKHQGRLLVWLSDDQRKLPVMMKSKIVVGSIVAKLARVNL